MQDLAELIKKFTPSEITSVNNYFKSTLSGKSETAYLKAFKYILENKRKPITDAAFYAEVLERSTSSACRMFKIRFTEKILDAVTIQQNISKSSAAEELDRAWFTLNNKMLQLHYIYRTKGNTPFVMQLITDIEKKAKLFEIYSVLLEVLRFKKYLIGFKKGNKYVDEINKEINEYEFCQQAKNKANDYYLKFTTDANFIAAANTEEKIKFLRDCIYELRQDYKQCKSNGILYYCKLLEIAYHELMSDYDTALKATNELHRLTNKEKSVKRNVRIAVALINKSHFNIYLKNYSEAEMHSRESLKYIAESSNNYWICVEQIFLAQFYTGDYKSSYRTINRALKANELTHGKFRIDKYKYYMANVLLQTDAKKAQRILNEKLEISTDKAGWDVAIRILRIQCAIELKQLDFADVQIAELNRQYYRITNNLDLLNRNKACIKLLTHIAKNGFVFENHDEETYNLLEKLTTSKNKWLPFTPELYPLEKWLAKKCSITLAPHREKFLVNK